MIDTRGSALAGVLFSSVDHRGGLPVLACVVRESGRPGRYRHTAIGRTPDHIAVQVTLAGCGTVWTGQQQRGPGTPLPRGRCLVFRFGQQVRYAAAHDSPEPWTFVYANIGGAAALAMADDLIAAHGHVLPVDPELPAIDRLVRLAEGSGMRHRRLAVAASAQIACDLLCALAAGCGEQADPQRDLVEQASAILGRHLDRSIDIADVAKTCGVSREHLTRLFRRRTGLAPAAWRRRERLRHAEVLLRSGTRPVGEVAALVGFATASHFVHAFRTTFGHTPGWWRGR